MKRTSGRNPDAYLADTGRNARRGFGLHSLRSVGAKIYAIIALCFLTFVGVDAYQMWSAKLGLESQRRTEIKHLTEVARAAVQEEYAASQAGSISVEEARERAAARIAGLRCANSRIPTARRSWLRPTRSPRATGKATSIMNGHAQASRGRCPK